MKLIYHCYGGAHSSVTAAAIHLGLLPLERRPRGKELMGVPYYDRQSAKDHGLLRFMGTDECSNEVFIVGRHRQKATLDRLFHELAKLYNCPSNDYLLIDVMPCVNIWMKVGGFLSRRLGWIAIGRPLVLWGTQIAFDNLMALVLRTKNRACTLAKNGA